MHKKEIIAVIPREILFKNTIYKEGFFPCNDTILENIQKNKIGWIRDEAETDYTLKQIVSYIIFIHDSHIFLMERSDTSSEQRLKNQLSIGIGGHLRLEDLNKDILSWGLRELYEEVNYSNTFKMKLMGIINDESNNVGKLHIGIVYLMYGIDNAITIKSELKSGKLIPICQCIELCSELESWSQLIIHYIKDTTLINAL